MCRFLQMETMRHAGGKTCGSRNRTEGEKASGPDESVHLNVGSLSREFPQTPTGEPLPVIGSEIILAVCLHL